jgi:hypothetical protein
MVAGNQIFFAQKVLRIPNDVKLVKDELFQNSDHREKKRC